MIVPAASGLGEREVITGPRLSMYAYATPMILRLTTLLATTCTGFCPGSATGAVYKPAALIFPPPVLADTDQVTAVLESPITCAVNCTVPATTTDGLWGKTATL
jgi:hypothetical protein